MAVHLDVIWIPSIGDILLGSGGADTWLRIGLLIGIVAGIVYKLISLFDKYKKGKHLDDPKFQDCIVYRRAKSVHVTAPEGFAYSLDGEIVEENDFVASVVPGAIPFVLPREEAAAEKAAAEEEAVPAV